MTKREYFVELKNLVADNADMVAFLDKEIALLDKKASRPRKATATQLENEACKAEIVAYLTAVDTAKSIKELQAEVACLNGMTCQRVTHMLTALVKAEVLVKNYVKKTPFYSVA